MSVTPFIPVLSLKLNDSEDADALPACRAGHQFIEAALAESPNNIVLVACRAGISRSATVVIYHLMMRANKPLECDKAIRLVTLSRPCVDPNDGFRAQLAAVSGAMVRDSPPAGRPPGISVEFAFRRKPGQWKWEGPTTPCLVLSLALALAVWLSLSASAL
jgi:hypothetical protein